MRYPFIIYQTPSSMKKQKKEQINLLKTLKKLEQSSKKGSKNPKNKKGTNPFVLLFIIAILLSGVYTFLASPTKEVVNTDIGLNDIQARYAS